MKIDRKRFVLAIVISLILSCIVFVYFELTTTQRMPPKTESFLMKDIVESQKQAYLSIFLLICFSLVSFVILTLVFYFVIGLLKKRKEN